MGVLVRLAKQLEQVPGGIMEVRVPGVAGVTGAPEDER
jgi:hypothetical protein